MKTQLDKYWHALYVKSRSEKKVAERLASKGLEVYCPLQLVIRQWTDRRKKVLEPLFRSYVFVRLSESDRLNALQTYGVVGFVKWLGQPALIQPGEIAAIREFLQEYENIQVQSFNSYREGDEVRVTSGPMHGAHGHVLRQKKHKVTLRLEQLGMDLTAELPKSHLEPVL